MYDKLQLMKPVTKIYNKEKLLVNENVKERVMQEDESDGLHDVAASSWSEPSRATLCEHYVIEWEEVMCLY